METQELLTEEAKKAKIKLIKAEKTRLLKLLGNLNGDKKKAAEGLIDELHAIKDKNLYDVIIDGTTARDQPLMLVTTTAGTVRDNVYDEKYDYASKVVLGVEGFDDEHLLPVIYELDSRDEWTDPECWKKANPSLGGAKNYDAFKIKVEKAMRDSNQVKNLLCKDFNIRETSTDAWLNFEELNNEETFDITELRPKYGIGGTDLSKNDDLTAAKVIFMLPGDLKIYVLQMYWLPEDLLEQKVKEDKVPYDKWHMRDLLRVTPGNSVHPKYVTEWFKEVQEKYNLYIPYIGYDGWSAKYWVEEMEGYFGKQAMIPVFQGKKTLSSPMHLLKADFVAKKIIYNNNPIDKFNFSNTVVDIDKNGNIQPKKIASKSRLKIDGTAALLNAYVILQDKMNDYLNMI